MFLQRMRFKYFIPGRQGIDVMYLFKDGHNGTLRKANRNAISLTSKTKLYLYVIDPE